MSGRQSLSQIVLGIAASLVQHEIENDLRYLTEKRLLAAEGLAVDQATAQKGLLLHLLGTQRKVAATTTGEAAQTAATASGVATRAGVENTGFFARLLSLIGIHVGAHAASEATKTAATVGGATARAASEVSAQAAAFAASRPIAAAQALSLVGLAGAGGVASMAAAPFPLDLAAPAFGAAMAATAGTFAAMASFDKGTNLLPHDMRAQIHAGERIVPAADNAKLIQLTEMGAGVGGRRGDMHVHFSPTIHPTTKPDVIEGLEENFGDFMRMMKRAHRNGEFRFS